MSVTMLHADCMEFMRGQPDGAFDLAIVDPEYRDLAENQPTKDMRANGGMGSFSGKPTEEYFRELRRVSKEWIVWGANNFQLPPFKGFVVWRKTTISEDFTMSAAEMAAISEGLGTTSKVFDCAPQGTAAEPRIHVNQKPVALYKWLLTRYAKPGQRILDTHGGSGSDCIAVHDVNADLVSRGLEPMSITWMELDADYYSAAVKRYETHAAQLHLFEPGPEAKPEQGTLL